MSLTRRSALRIVALSAATPFLEGLSIEEILTFGQTAHARAQAPGLRVLGPDEHRIVLAATERILPATDTPGAAEAGVDRFIDVLLADWYSDEERERFLAGLDELDDASRERNGTSFVESSVAEQTELLETMDRRRHDDSNHWFGMLKFLTLWGYFTSEVGVTQELAKHERRGIWQGCAPVAPPREER